MNSCSVNIYIKIGQLKSQGKTFTLPPIRRLNSCSGRIYIKMQLKSQGQTKVYGMNSGDMYIEEKSRCLPIAGQLPMVFIWHQL